jgi:hypothetical protein
VLHGEVLKDGLNHQVSLVEMPGVQLNFLQALVLFLRAYGSKS